MTDNFKNGKSKSLKIAAIILITAQILLMYLPPEYDAFQFVKIYVSLANVFFIFWINLPSIFKDQHFLEKYKSYAFPLVPIYSILLVIIFTISKLFNPMFADSILDTLNISVILLSTTLTMLKANAAR